MNNELTPTQRVEGWPATSLPTVTGMWVPKSKARELAAELERAQLEIEGVRMLHHDLLHERGDLKRQVEELNQTINIQHELMHNAELRGASKQQEYCDQLHAECAAELLNVLKAYDAAYKRADELRYMLEQIVNFRSKTPEDRDDLLNDARKLLEAPTAPPSTKPGKEKQNDHYTTNRNKNRRLSAHK